MWFQLYVFEDRSMTKTVDLIRRAEKAGVVAFAVTVDAPVLGRRERDVRNKFAMRAGMKLDNVARRRSLTTTSRKRRERAFVVFTRRHAVDANDTRERCGTWTDGRKREASATDPRLRENAKESASHRAARRRPRRVVDVVVSASGSKRVTDAPIILKGVTRRDDAARAVDAGRRRALGLEPRREAAGRRARHA